MRARFSALRLKLGKSKAEDYLSGDKETGKPTAGAGNPLAAGGYEDKERPVSYTHLTLPTNREV